MFVLCATVAKQLHATTCRRTSSAYSDGARANPAKGPKGIINHKWKILYFKNNRHETHAFWTLKSLKFKSSTLITK